VWLILVPWLTCLAWRLAFVRGFNEVRSCHEACSTALHVPKPDVYQLEHSSGMQPTCYGMAAAHVAVLRMQHGPVPCMS
jgi:hypothetical protein